MTYKLIKEQYLTDIANAIRGANNEKDTLYKPSEMSAAIRELKKVSTTDFSVTGNCDYAYAGSAFSNVVEDAHIEGTDITSAEGMFYKYGGKEIYADLTFDTTEGVNAAYMFANCENLESISLVEFISFYPKDCRYMFANCCNLKYEPELETRSKAHSKFNETTRRQTGITFWADDWGGGGEYFYEKEGSCVGMFKNCHSLNSISSYIMPGLYNEGGVENFYAQMFKNCYTLASIPPIPVNTTAEINDNQFYQMVKGCDRLGGFLFETDSSGQPLVVKWKNQDIDLRTIGFTDGAYAQERLFGYSSLIKDKAIEMTNLSEFVQYKNNSYSWTSNADLSRYTYEDMIETLESLPDTSAYSVDSEGGLHNKIRLRIPNYYSDGTSIAENFVDLATRLQAMVTAKGWQIYFGPNNYTVIEE